MTLVDLAWLVVGTGLGIVAVTTLPGLAFIPPPLVRLALSVASLGGFAAIAASAMAFGRAASYRRMPRPAEWLTLLVASTTLAKQDFLDVDRLVNVLAEALPGWGVGLDFNIWRWVVAGLFGAAILVGLGVSWVGRRWFAPWARTLILAGIALLALAGPIGVFTTLGADLVSPSEGFGKGTGPILHRQACALFGLIPIAFLFGLPAVAALGERLAGRRWSWVEWSSLFGPGLVGFSMTLFYRGEFPFPSTGWALERALLLAWFLGIALTSRWILIHLAPPPGPEPAEPA